MVLGNYIEGMFGKGVMSNERFDDVMRLICHLGGTDLSNVVWGRISSHSFEVMVAIERSLHRLWGIPGIREVTEVVEYFG